MFDLYECPDCHRSHDEPAEPAYVLAVRCLDCALELHLEREIRVQPLAPAA
jgi:hypothetical protein